MFRIKNQGALKLKSLEAKHTYLAQYSFTHTACYYNTSKWFGVTIIRVTNETQLPWPCPTQASKSVNSLPTDTEDISGSHRMHAMLHLSTFWLVFQLSEVLMLSMISLQYLNITSEAHHINAELKYKLLLYFFSNL